MVGRGGLVVSVVIVPTNIRRGCHTETRCDTALTSFGSTTASTMNSDGVTELLRLNHRSLESTPNFRARTGIAENGA
jgi:hypothetical protein